MSNLKVFSRVGWPFAKCSSLIATKYDNSNSFIHHYEDLEPRATQHPTTTATATMIDSAERGSPSNYREALFQLHCESQELSISGE
jgi:hypothetical protein